MTHQPKILLIDDDPTQVAILSAYLSSLRITRVESASDGAIAKRMIQATDVPYDTIFTDLSMPNLDGFEFLKFLAASNFKGEVIIISGHENILLESAASLGKMYGLSVSGQIRKPLTKYALDRLFAEKTEATSQSTESQPNTMSQDQIKKGLEHNEFVPFYQPKVDLLSGKIIGAEALARWNHPEKGLISPIAFIPTAEACGLIDDITISIFDQIANDIHKGGETWKGKKISFNLPSQMVHNSDLPDMLSGKLAQLEIPNSAICIDITESGIIEFDPLTIEVLSRLRIKGFDLSIDDFGTGAANISNLKVFPYSELKIDQSFINNVLTDAFSAETVRTSLTLARQLNLRVVAEGIETNDVLQYVKSKGIDQAQGYLFSKPVPLDNISELFDNPMGWLANGKPVHTSAA